MIKFLKYQNCGNDFILIDEQVYLSNIQNFANFVKLICSRKFGVGADGIIFATKNEYFEMNYYNSDGTIAPMCGNGMIVFRKYLEEEFQEKSEIMYIKTKESLVEVKLSDQIEVKVNLVPKINTLKIDTTYYQTYTMTDHVVRIDEFIPKNWEEIGNIVENHSLFLNKTNVNFVQIENQNTIFLKTYERGAKATLGCGTGALAAALVSFKNFSLENKITVKQMGGNLEVTINDDSMILGGNPKKVFEGIYYMEENYENI